MNDSERTKTTEDAKRVRDHVRKLLSKLAASQEDKRVPARSTPKPNEHPD
jgi:hypothetical protein